jgi:UDP-GlcNAc:undecaprenyl-phosphate/decaprenyl-phosphate GlcNAc-1-phosphate transferase
LNQLVAQTNTALIALILAGAYAGFLVFNWHPAKIFLGESGGLLAGFMIGVLAIISGSKVATTLLIMGVPIIDLAWVILQRVLKRKSLGVGDRRHLHYRLLDVGLTHRQAVVLLLFLTAFFGSLSVFLQTFGKLIALGIVVLVMIILGSVIYFSYKKNESLE